MVPHRFSINLNKEGYQKIINVRASDNEIHRLYISISNGTEPVELDNNTVATIYCWKPNGEKVWNNCEISNNEVICDFSGVVLNCCGDIVCELFLSTLGTNIITPKFVISVESTLPFPHFNLLEEQPENWLDEADLCYIKNENGDFVPVELNANRNLLSGIEFPYDKPTGGSDYKSSTALDFEFNRKLYISYYGDKSNIELTYEFYYSNNGNAVKLIESHTTSNKTTEIKIPNITKRQLIEKGFDGIRLVLSIKKTNLTSVVDGDTTKYYATDWVLEYDECSYKNCKTPYFEKGKYYIMTNDYGKSGEQYNALIKAITEAREFYNKAISDIKLVDNCLTIDFVNGEKYVSEPLKGNGIKSFAKVSTSGNVDTYEFVADNGEKFSFSVTNADNTVLQDIKEKLEKMVGDINTTINGRTGEVKRNETALDVTINSKKVFGGKIGSAIIIETSQYWNYACVNVTPKSIIKVTTSRNANTGIEGYVYFTDDNDIIISKEISATDTEDIITRELTVPDNATKMYVQASGRYSSNGIKVVLLETIDLQTQIDSQQTQIDSQQVEVTTLNSRIGDPIKKETALDVTINSGKVFGGKIGSTITIETSQYWAYACVNVTPKSIIKVTTSRNANTGIDGYVYFTDDNGIIISKEIPATDTQDIISEELIVPDNATKMYVRNSGTYASKGIKAVLITDYPVYDKIADLENDIDEIENKISDPLPSYYKAEWLNSHYSAIREQVQVLHGVSFAFVTDLHFPSNAQNSKYLIKNILDNTTVPFALCGGDFPGAYGTQEACDKTMGLLIDYQNTIGKDRFFSTRGNHDFSIRTSSTENTGYTAPVAKTYDAIVRNSEFTIDSIQAGKFYYHIDIPAQKTRIFMLSSCDTQNSETTPWGINYNVSQAQIDWLLKKMQEKDGWYYIFISHIPADPAIESYNSSQDELHNIMLALKNKTTYGDVDFSTSNNVAVCHIVGHNHKNQSNVDNNFLSISTTCDAYYGDDGDGAKKGTLTEQAIDVFTIDYDNGTVQTHRVGRGSDRSWNY